MMHRCVNDHFPFNLNQPSSDLTREWTLRWTHFRKERLEIFQPFFAPPQNLYNNTKLIKILLYIYIYSVLTVKAFFQSTGQVAFDKHGQEKCFHRPLWLMEWTNPGQFIPKKKIPISLEGHATGPFNFDYFLRNYLRVSWPTWLLEFYSHTDRNWLIY